MRVLVQAGGFFPAKKYGGPVVSVDNLCTLLNDDCEFYLLARDHDQGSKERLTGICEGWNQRENCKVRYLRESEMTNNTILGIIEEVNPDLIYMNSLFDVKLNHPIYSAIKRSKGRIPILMAPRGQLCANAFQFGKLKKELYCCYFRLLSKGLNFWWQSTSDEETQSIICQCKVSKDRIINTTNIPSKPKPDLNHPYKDDNALRCVFISRIHPKKNLLFVIEQLADTKRNIRFDIYGAIEDAEYWHKCEEAISRLPHNVTCTYGGLIEHNVVFDVFAKYELFVFPTLSENYGHVIIESLLAGCPVLISDQTPWNDVEIKGVGVVCALGEPKKFLAGLEQFAALTDGQYHTLRERCTQYAESKTNFDALKGMYSEMIGMCAGLLVEQPSKVVDEK